MVTVVLVIALVQLTGVMAAFAGTLTSTSFTVMDPRTGIAGNRYDWGFTTATTNTLSKVTMSVSAGTSGPSRYLALPGSYPNYASTPDSAGNSITGDIDIRVKATLVSWSSIEHLVCKWNSTNQSYCFSVFGGNLRLYLSSNGLGTYTPTSSVVTGFADGSTGWVRATFSPNNGAGGDTATFYTSSNGTNWTQLGTTITAVGTSPIYDSNTPLVVGTSFLDGGHSVNGKVYYADVRSGITSGTTTSPSGCSSSSTIANCFDPNQAPPTISTGSNTWTSSTGEVWTVNRSGTNLPSDIASDLSVANVSGLPTGGTAVLRQMDGTATYNLASATSISSGTAISIGLMGFTNTSTVNSYTSTITTYDNSSPPVSKDSATTASVSFTGPAISSWSSAPPVVSSATTATSVDMMAHGLGISGTKVYISDYYANTVLSLDTTTGNAIGIAGDGVQGSGGSTTATSAMLYQPTGVGADSSGNVFIADTANNVIRKVTSGGAISVVAGGGGNGSATYSGPGTSAGLSTPRGLAVDSAGNVYFADYANAVVRKLDTSGNISTVAGTGTASFTGDGGAATSATLNGPTDVAVDSSGDLFIADRNNNRIREVTNSSGNISTVAGTGTASFSGDGAAATAATINAPSGIAVDAAGNLYIADTGNNRVRKVTNSTGFISTVAGTGTASFSGDGAAATAATLNQPSYTRVDGSGNVYFVDWMNQRVRKIDTSGNISTVAGTGQSSYKGDGGNIANARFYQPAGMTTDSAGNTYVADQGNNVVRKITKWGTVSTIAGTGTPGFSGDGAAATSAMLHSPRDVKVDSAGNVYIADMVNNRLRVVNTSGNISTVANLSTPLFDIAISPVNGNIYGTINCQVVSITPGGTVSVIMNTANTCNAGDTGDGGAATAATMNLPRGIAFDSTGKLYVADWAPQRVRVIDTSGNISSFAGGGASSSDGVVGQQENLNAIDYLSTDVANNVYVENATKLRVMSPNGLLTTIAGSGSTGYSGDGGAATAASFTTISGETPWLGSLLIADSSTNVIRDVSQGLPIAPNVNADSISVAENRALTWPVESNDWSQSGEMDPNSVTITSNGSHGTAIVNTTQGQITTVTYTPTNNYTGSDSYTYQACDSTLVLCGTATVSVTVGSNQVTTVAGGLTEGLATNIGLAPARSARFRNYLFISDSTYSVIRRYDIYSKQMTVVAGIATAASTGDSGPATAAGLNTPRGIAFMPDGTMEIADSGNNKIRQISAAGTITTVAGTGTSSNTGDGSAATSATITSPTPLAFGIDGSLFIGSGNKVRKMTVGGNISTCAGNGTTGDTGDGGAASAAELNTPAGFAVDSAGDLYLADSGAHVVRKVTYATGNISTVAGTANTSGSSGDGGAATSATLNAPKGLAIDSSGNIYVADSGNNKIRRFTDGGTISTVAGTTGGYSGDNGAATSAKLSAPTDVTLGTNGTDYYITDGSNALIRYVNTGAVISTVVGNTSTSYAGDGLTALNTQLTGGSCGAIGAALAVSSTGDIYFGGCQGYVRKLSQSTGVFSSTATLPTEVSGTIDPNGLFAFVATLNARQEVERWNANTSLTVIAGGASFGFSGDGGLATSALLNAPRALAYDAAGDLYIADRNNARIRRVDHATGIITTIAGTGTAGYTGDGGLATNAELNQPYGLAFDPSGNLYVVDRAINVVRMIDPNGIITTVAGIGNSSGSSGDNGPATSAKLSGPNYVGCDGDGNVYIADANNNKIRKVDATTGIITTVVGNGTAGFVDNTTYSSAELSSLSALYVQQASGDVYFSDGGDNRIRKAAGLASTTTNNLSSATWTIVPPASGHSNLRERFVVTPSATVTASKLTFTMPTGVTGTPTVVSNYGLSGTVSASLSGTTLAVTFPSQTLNAGTSYGLGFEGWTGGGSNGSYSSNVTLYDSAGTTAIGWARSTIVNLSGGTGAPSSTDPGYSSVWARSSTYTPSASSVNLAVNPGGGSLADQSTSLSVTTGGNLNTNSLALGASALTRTTPSTAIIATITSDDTTGVASGLFTTDRWGFALTTSTGTASGALGGTTYAGHTTSPQTVAIGTSAVNSYVLTERVKVDYLTPSGTYTSTLTAAVGLGT